MVGLIHLKENLVIGTAARSWYRPTLGAIAALALTLSLFGLSAPVRAGGSQPSPSSDCKPASHWTTTELRNLLLDAGSFVANPRNANGSTATSWEARVIVPKRVCAVTVSLTSYLLPSGSIRPFEDQVVF